MRQVFQHVSKLQTTHLFQPPNMVIQKQNYGTKRNYIKLFSKQVLCGLRLYQGDDEL